MDLRVIDDANLDGGSINEIILNLCYAAPTPGSGGYLGPGGVGNTDGTSNLVLWTNPDNIIEAENAAFSSWNDLSGYSSDLTQGTTSLQPKIKKNLINGYDVVRFETTNRRLRKTNFTNFQLLKSLVFTLIRHQTLVMMVYFLMHHQS